MATRYDSGVSGTLTERGDLDVRAWLARLLLDLEEQPIGSTWTCANPECDRLDYIGQGHAPHYCCKRCKNRAGEIRRRAAQQLDVITEFLEACQRQARHSARRVGTPCADAALVARADAAGWVTPADKADEPQR